MKHINIDFFLITLGLVFSLPNSEEIFLQSIVLSIPQNSNPTIPLFIFIIWALVSFGALIGTIDGLRKIYHMRGIITTNHIRNIIIGISLGAVVGFVLNIIFF